MRRGGLNKGKTGRGDLREGEGDGEIKEQKMFGEVNETTWGRGEKGNGE